MSTLGSTTAIEPAVLVLAAIAFVAVERRAPDPMVSFRLRATRPFARNLGSTLAAATFGAVQTFVFSHHPGAAGVQMDRLRGLLGAGAVHVATDDAVRKALEKSLDMTFLSAFVVSLPALVAMLLLPRVDIPGVTGARAAK